jgi:hypothetical protein
MKSQFYLSRYYLLGVFFVYSTFAYGEDLALKGSLSPDSSQLTDGLVEQIVIRIPVPKDWSLQGHRYLGSLIFTNIQDPASTSLVSQRIDSTIAISDFQILRGG